MAYSFIISYQSFFVIIVVLSVYGKKTRGVRCPRDFIRREGVCLKIILKYIFNNVRERMLRTTVMVLSIILSTTLLFVSLSIGDSYESAQLKMAKGFAGPATVIVSAKPDVSGSMVWISESEVPQIASVKDKIGFLTVTALYRNDDLFENFDLIAADIDKLNAINKPILLDGTEVTDFSGNSIILPEKFAAGYGLKPGDTVPLNIGGVNHDFRIYAIAAYDTVFLRQSRGFNALVPKETLSEILGASGGNSKIYIVPQDGVNADNLKSELASALQKDRYSITKAYDEAQVASDARQKSLPFYLISFFSFVMSVFIIFSSYKVITLERLPVIGTFRSIGATQKATTRILLWESLIYGIIGGLVGIPVGYAVLKLILDGLGQSLSLGIDIPMVVKPMNIMLACMTGTVVSLFSAYIPVRRASRLPVKDVVLGKVEEKNTSNKVKLIFGIALFIVSVILPQIVGKENNNLLMAAGGLSLLGMIASAVIVTPLFANVLFYMLERVYGKLLGNEGKLAARNMRNNRNINQNITLLFISLTAVIVISTVSGFVSSYLGDVFAGGSIDGFADGNMSSEFVQTVKEYEGIKELVPIYELDNMINAYNVQFSRMEAVDDLSSMCSLINIKFENSETKRAILEMFNKDRNILISKDCLKQRNLNVGDRINLNYSGKTYEYKILGVFQSRGDNSEAIIPGEYARSDFGAVNYGKLAYSADDPDFIMAQIRNLFGNNYNWSRTVKEYSEDALKIINSFMAPMKKLTYFILLLAAVGVINNLIINYIQKKRDIAMFISVGMSKWQNVKITVIEGFTAGLIGAAIGLFVSYMEIKTIFTVAGPRISVTPEFDATVFAAAGLAGIVITLIGSIVPILKASKMKLVEELKFE